MVQPSVDRFRKPRVVSFAWLALVLTVGALIRLASLHNSLWLDELSTLWAVEGTLSQLLQRVPQTMGMSSFYFFLPWISIHALGESEVALRLPSLLAIGACTVLVAMAAARIGGRRAALWSALLLWLSYPAVWESLNARPYAVAWFFASLAVLGLARACTTPGGSRAGRVMWVLGAAGVGWAQYLYLPFVAAIGVSALLDRRLRFAYSIRQAAVDAGLIAGLLLPAVPHIVSLLVGRHAQAWSLSPRPLALVAPLVPFVLAALMPAARARETDAAAPLRRALWIGVGAQVVAIMGASVVSVDLTASRYVGVTVVAAALLAGLNMARLAKVDLVAPLAAYALTTGAGFYATYQVCGSLSGAGYQQWREAVAAMRMAYVQDPGAPVLFRSGNAEDDLSAPDGSLWPASLAPLRSPGEAAPNWDVVLLTYRWTNPDRAAYFDRVVRAAVTDRRAFYLLCLVSDEPGAHGYCSAVNEWIRQQWPGRFRAEPLGEFDQIMAIRFVRGNN